MYELCWSKYNSVVIPGDMVKVDNQKFYSVGKVLRTADNKFQIQELPIGVWTQTYIEKHFLLFSQGNEKIKPIFQDYSDDNTDEIVKFNVTGMFLLQGQFYHFRFD